MKRLESAANLDEPMHIEAPDIYELIDEFAREKYRRKPWEAGAQRGLLRRFAQNFKITGIHQITKDHVAFFAGEEVSEYFSEQALVALRQFLWYCKKGGYKCLGHNVCRKEQLQRIENGVKINETPSWDIQPEWNEPLEDREILPVANS